MPTRANREIHTVQIMYIERLFDKGWDTSIWLVIVLKKNLRILKIKVEVREFPWYGSFSWVGVLSVTLSKKTKAFKYGLAKRAYQNFRFLSFLVWSEYERQTYTDRQTDIGATTGCENPLAPPPPQPQRQTSQEIYTYSIKISSMSDSCAKFHEPDLKI